MKKSYLIIALVVVFGVILGISQDDQKSNLAIQRARILKELEDSKRILRNVKKDKTNSLVVLNAVQTKLKARQALIENYKNSVVEINGSIQSTEGEIDNLEDNIDKLKVDYAQMIKYAYIHRTSLSIISLIFSSQSYQETFKQIGYLQKYRQVRDEQLSAILNSQEKLEDKIGYYDRQKKNKTTMMEAEIKQKDLLEQERLEKEKIYQGYQGQEKEIRAKIAKQTADARKLESQIQYIIKKEQAANAARIAAEKERQAKLAKEQEAKRQKEIEQARIAREKAEAERRKIEEERKRQEEEARIAKQKEEDRLRKEQERLQKIQDEKKRQQKEEQMAAAKQKAEEAYEKRQAELNRIKREEAAAQAKVNEAKEKETQSEKVIPTPSTSGVTGFSAGSIGRPVSGRIVGHFGTQSHPVFKNIKIENNGIDIYSSSGSPVHSVYDGIVSSVLSTPGGNGSTVLINHGEYYTVYTNLASIKVGSGSKVRKGQIIGSVGSNADGDPIINFQIWKSSGGSSYKLNPESWVRY